MPASAARSGRPERRPLPSAPPPPRGTATLAPAIADGEQRQLERELLALLEVAARLAATDEFSESAARWATLGDDWHVLSNRLRDSHRREQLRRRFKSERDRFLQRRDRHAESLSRERQEAQRRKTFLCVEAERLVASGAPTLGADGAARAERMRELEWAWRAAGHAGGPAENLLWPRFHAACTAFQLAHAAPTTAASARTAGAIEGSGRLP